MNRFFVFCVFFFSLLSDLTAQIDYKGPCSIGCPSFCREDCVRGLRNLEEALTKAPDLNSRMEAAKYLGQFKGKGRIPILESALKKEGNRKNKNKEFMDELKNSLFLAFSERLEEGSTSDKKKAMEGLQGWGCETSKVVEKLEDLLFKDKELENRKNAIRHLWWIAKKEEDQGILDKIVESLRRVSEEDVSEEIRDGAKTVLRWIH